MKEILAGEGPGKSTGKLDGKVAWRDVSMTETTLFDRIERDMEARFRGAEGASVRVHLAEAGVDLGGADYPGLSRRFQVPWADRLLGALLHLMPDDEVAVLVVVVAVLPEFRWMAGRLVRSGVPSDDAAAAVVHSALGALTHTPTEVREVLAETWRRCRTEIRRCDRVARSEVAWEVGGEEIERRRWTVDRELDEPVLTRALRARVLTFEQAVLLHETRGLGRTLPDVAAEWGRPVKRVTSTRRRAEARLRAMLEAEGERENRSR